MLPRPAPILTPGGHAEGITFGYKDLEGNFLSGAETAGFGFCGLVLVVEVASVCHGALFRHNVTCSAAGTYRACWQT